MLADPDPMKEAASNLYGAGFQSEVLLLCWQSPRSFYEEKIAKLEAELALLRASAT